MRRLLALAFVLSLPIVSTAKSPEANASGDGKKVKKGPIRVVIWDEQQPSQKKAYSGFLGKYIADYLKRQPGLEVNAVTIDHPEKGLSDKVLDQCDVLVWWGHVRNGEVSVAEAERVVRRIREGKLNFIALHSAHWATPFVMAMHDRAKSDAFSKLTDEQRKSASVEWIGKIVRRAPKRDATLTPKAKVVTKDGKVVVQITRPNCCFPAYRNDGKSSELTTLMPDHPIAAGVPKKFTLPHTEMYDEPFHVPAPDQVIFREDWKLGEHFRSGMVWKVGKGKVFYFRPGHETHAVFVEKTPLKIVENAIRWLGK